MRKDIIIHKTDKRLGLRIYEKFLLMRMKIKMKTEDSNGTFITKEIQIARKPMKGYLISSVKYNLNHNKILLHSHQTGKNDI